LLGLFGPKSGKIGVYKAALIYQGPFKEGFSAGSPVINEVVLEEVLPLDDEDKQALRFMDWSGSDEELMKRVSKYTFC
jgi:hypothetical protein